MYPKMSEFVEIHFDGFAIKNKLDQTVKLTTL